MKKKLLSAVSFILVLTMIMAFPLEVFAKGKEPGKKPKVGPAPEVRSGEFDEQTEPAAEETVSYYAGNITGESKNYKAVVTVDESAEIPEGTVAKVTEFAKGSAEYEDAKAKVVAEKGEDVEGFAAFDISLYNGEEMIEPASSVKVSIEAKGLPENATDVEISHIDESTGETVVELVASADDIVVDGDTINAEIAVEGFSTFVLTWTEGGVDKFATIHWVTYEDGVDKELDTSTTIDSTATNVDINVIIDAEKYYFIGADYRLTEDAEEFENLKSTVLKKVDGVWQISLEDSGTVPVADGSHIFVHYAPYSQDHPYSPPSPPSPEVLSPDTEKTVTDNEDGTYTIRLDIEGKSDHSTTQVGANIVVIMDITQSMTNSISGGSTRMAAAKQALRTLINTLDPDTNLINFRAINFGDDAQPYEGISWTTDKATMLSYANGLPNNPTDMGTCWQAGLRGGYNIVTGEVAANNNLKNNATYVVFVTDGNPNCYSRNDDGTGRWIGATGPNYNAEAYQRAAYWANRLGPVCNFYGVYCGNSNDSGLGYLRDLISAANGGSDANFINGTSSSAIESAFENIATTIVNNLGAGGVTVDDGIPTLSNVSANVSAGEAGGFKYYIKPALGEETEWEDAPGATYSQTNGVTWDLGEAGELQNGWIYSLEFTVWPSQAAYDLIADLNNGKRNYSDLSDEEKAAVQGSKEAGYTLLTNTHLYTTFTDLNGQEYRETNNAVPKAMPLPAPTISVEKLWNNFLDSRDDVDIDGLQLVLTRDGDEYLEFDVDADSGWKKDGIYISCGQIVDGTIKETGHDYYVTEKPREDIDKTEYWEVNSPYYHPMVVDGEMVLFIRDDDASQAAFELNGHKYVEASSSSTSLTAVNERVSWLNLTKAVEGEGAPSDALFKYNVTITEPAEEGSEMSVFFSVRGGGSNYRDDIETNATKWVDTSTGNTYYYAANGSEIWLKIKAGWNARFLNIATGSTYSITEVEEEMEPGFVFDSAKNVETFYSAKNTPATGYPITTTETQTTTNGAVVSGSTVTGKVNQTNTDYSVTYTNKYLGYFYVYHSSNNTLERYAMAENGVKVTSFNIFGRTAEGTLYGGYYKDYTGKSVDFDAAALDYSGSAYPKDEGGKAYTYAYIKEQNRGAWKEADAYTVSGKAMVPEQNNVYYLKEVPTAYILPYTHYTYNKADKLLRNMWYLTAIDDLNYQAAGFFVETFDANGKKTGTIVDTLKVTNTSGGATVTLSPSSLFGNKGGAGMGVQAGYLSYWDAKALIKENATSVFTPFWHTPDGIYVCGTQTRTVKFNNAKVGTGGMRITDAANMTPFPALES